MAVTGQNVTPHSFCERIHAVEQLCSVQGCIFPLKKRIHTPGPISDDMLCPDLHAPPTRNTRPQSDKGDRVDAVFKIDKAAEVPGDVAYDGGVPADKQNADYKSWVASPDSCKSKARQSISRSKTVEQRMGTLPRARCSDGRPQALAFVRRQKTLCWSKHHLSQTFRFQDCFTHSKTFCLVMLGTKVNTKADLKLRATTVFDEMAAVVHAGAGGQVRVAPGVEVQVYI